LLTTLVVGVFYVIVSYAVTIGYGVSAKHVQALATAATPFNTLADRFGDGTLSLFVNLAVISSFTALNIVTSSRSAGSSGRWPGRPASVGVQPAQHQAVTAYRVPVLRGAGPGRLDLVRGDLRRADFASWLSYFATLFFIAAYLLISVGLIRFMWRDYRAEFSWIRHGLLPVISIAAMIWVLWGNIHPYPPPAAVVHLRHRRRPGHQRPDRAVAGADQARRDAAAGRLLGDVEAEREEALAGSGEADA